MQSKIKSKAQVDPAAQDLTRQVSCIFSIIIFILTFVCFRAILCRMVFTILVAKMSKESLKTS